MSEAADRVVLKAGAPHASGSAVMSGQVDLVVRGGFVLDGTGAEGAVLDVAIDAGRIVAVGQVAASGREEIDARGKLVTPGFVDIHTHYDGQAIWSERLNPSSAHGVTTVVMGNCGVGFAPCRPGDRDLLVSVMEGVEDIPELVMARGLTWEWESFPEYLDALEARPHDIDVAAYIPHSALRLFVMGERGARREPATAEDRAAMARLVREAMAAGALGFATSLAAIHRTRDGDQIPSYQASELELAEIADALAGEPPGVFQLIPALDKEEPETVDLVMAMFERLAKRSGGTVTFSLVQTASQPERWREVLDRAAILNRQEGVVLRAQVIPRPIGVLMGLTTSLNPFTLCPTYQEQIAPLPLAQKVARLRDPQIRETLLEEGPSGPGPALFQRGRQFDRMFPMSSLANYEPDLDASVSSVALRRGVSPEEVAYDLLLEDEGHALLYLAMNNYAEGDLEATREMMCDPAAILGLGDGGAHYGLICDAGYTTHVLTHWTRDRARGRIPLAEAVRALSHAPAAAVGLNDRGLLRPGYKADLNVIDYEGLAALPPRMVHDLPGGGGRLDQGACGYVATVVNGQVIARAGEPTGRLPGRLVRTPRGDPPDSPIDP